MCCRPSLLRALPHRHKINKVIFFFFLECSPLYKASIRIFFEYEFKILVLSSVFSWKRLLDFTISNFKLSLNLISVIYWHLFISLNYLDTRNTVDILIDDTFSGKYWQLFIFVILDQFFNRRNRLKFAWRIEARSFIAPPCYSKL